VTRSSMRSNISSESRDFAKGYARRGFDILSGSSAGPYSGIHAVWIEYANWDLKFFVDDAHWLRQVGIVGNDDKLVAVCSESVDKHIRSDVYI